jgi:phosphoribosylformylglycinamidine synthase subunit PurSL
MIGFLVLSGHPMRYEIYYRNHQLDGRALRIRRAAESALGITIANLAVTDIYIVEPDNLIDLGTATELFSDPVAQSCAGEPAAGLSGIKNWTHAIEVGYRPGVTDPVAITAREAISTVLGKETAAKAIIQTARQYLFELKNTNEANLENLAGFLHNPLIERAVVVARDAWDSGERFPDVYPNTVAASSLAVRMVMMADLDEAGLGDLSKTRLLALSVEEMRAVQGYFNDPAVAAERRSAGLPSGVTDVELEMIAQTWSEHCKHKIMNAQVKYTENGKTETIDSLFNTYIRRTTTELESTRSFLRSVFHDDSGVIAFDEETLVCFKVETHNSPSALDPYGGAITGIVGVNRDILGTGKGALPIFNTNVLCFGYPDTNPADIPAGLLHPKRVLSGVHHGIIDGGNQSGIPVVGGAFLFDESYTGKPLVFCGTGGILPAEIGGEGAWIQHIDPGDLAVMVGGRIGKDGIHGATFSSLPLDESSPTSAVQIGDPITQKKMGDLLIEARDLGLYKGITDNGAGGLSSSLGEMAEGSGGIRIYLDKCPLKYEGLAPWEILVSESQERMSLAVAPDTIDAFLELAQKRDVEATVVGKFTDSSLIEIFHEGKTVGRMSIEFLHNGLPPMHLRAEWRAPERPEPVFSNPKQNAAAGFTDDLLALLADPNIASKEDLVRQYDHEVQARSVIKPFSGRRQEGPSDGGVLKMKTSSQRGLTVTHGVCPRYGDVDTYDMAMCAVDEAFRAHIAMGGDPEYAAVLDNFCWPDPVESESSPDGAYKMAQLVRACKGLYEACTAYGLPLISGKDSMKNDAVLDGKKVSVRPTLLISLTGVIRDVEKAVNTDFKRPGDLVYVLGMTKGELGGSSYERLKSRTMGGCPRVDPVSALALYGQLHKAIDTNLLSSCHDISDGGLAVALAESALAGEMGIEVNLDTMVVADDGMDVERLLFCESPSRFVVSINPAHRKKFDEIMTDTPCVVVGTVDDSGHLIVRLAKETLIDTCLEKVREAWGGGVDPV